MSKLEKEARLLTALSKELGVLATLERFKLHEVRDPFPPPPGLLVSNCKVSFETPHATNGADEEIAMAEHVSLMVAEGIGEICWMVLEKQRKTVEEARKALAEFQNADFLAQDVGGASQDPPPAKVDFAETTEAERARFDEVKDGVDIFEDEAETV